MSTIREEKKKKTISIEKNREEVKEKALFQLSPGGMRYGKAVMLRGGGGGGIRNTEVCTENAQHR